MSVRNSKDVRKEKVETGQVIRNGDIQNEDQFVHSDDWRDADQAAVPPDVEPELTDEELRELDKTELERYRLKDRAFPDTMDEKAFIGVAGEIVEIIEPVSEASREAVLAQLLVAFGNMIGRGPHRKQAGIHRLNEFAVLVGETAIARKGTSSNR